VFTGADCSNDFERAGQVGGPHRVAVADGARQGREVAIGGGAFGQYAAGSFGQRDLFDGGQGASLTHVAEHRLASFVKGQRLHASIIACPQMKKGAR